MSTPQASASPFPTKNATYRDNKNRKFVFNWTRPMPNNGYLGDITYLSYVNKPVQAFAATVDYALKAKVWQFQAQDGSFLCSMRVTNDQTNVTFYDNKIGSFPPVTVVYLL